MPQPPSRAKSIFVGCTIQAIFHELAGKKFLSPKNNFMNEPSVLDYVKAKLFPWKYNLDQWDMAEITRRSGAENPNEDFKSEVDVENRSLGTKRVHLKLNMPWYLFLALVFALIGQILLEPPRQLPVIAAIFYFFSFCMIVIAFLKKDKLFAHFPMANDQPINTELTKNQYVALIVSFIALIIAFFAFHKSGNNDLRFNSLNLFFWLLSLASFVYAMFDFRGNSPLKIRVRDMIKAKKVNLTITPWFILVAGVFILVVFFRFSQLNQILGEMFSDHAEKLLDVYDVLKGDYHVFFVRNTGREFFQFYWTALIAIVFKTGISFLSLKLGTALAGFIALPFIYKLGKELGNKWIGLLAFFFAGISYWHNLISRVGLRFPLYPMFAAPALYFLIRGLRQKRRNDFIYAGIAVGLGLHGYSSTRFLPFVILVGIILYVLHTKNKDNRLNVIFLLTILIIASFIVFLPLFKFALINPEAVNYRALTRLGTLERNYPAPVGLIFLKNLWNAVTMFFYSNGNTWVHSIPFRPALDIVSAAFFFIGNLIVIGRYIRLRNWEDIFLLMSVPLLMMPSILSLAYPEENPSLNRTSGAIIPVFILTAIGFEGLFRRFFSVSRTNLHKSLVAVIAFGLLIGSANLNYDLVFHQFNRQFMQNAWNSSQIGGVIRGFADSVGDADNAYVVPSAHWVDTRLVGIVAGFPTRDFALWPEHFAETVPVQDQKLFILKPENDEALQQLRSLYPNAALYRFDSGREGKDFLIFDVPALVAPLPIGKP